MGIKPSQKLELVMAGSDDLTKARLAAHESALVRLARLESISSAPEAPKGSAQIVVPGATACLPLAGVVDFAAEKARLEKEIAALDKTIKQLTGKLGNEKFIANAPEAVVEENRTRLADAEANRSKNVEALERVLEVE